MRFIFRATEALLRLWQLVLLTMTTLFALLKKPMWSDIQVLKGNSGIFKPGPYFWHEIRSSTHREQFGESRRPSEDI